tara:strand:+ start:5596 stop:5982 length:387 start_codon:yes stop_codon:yes gene_type:complete
MTQRHHQMQFLLFCAISFFVLISSCVKVSAEVVNWTEVAKTNNEIQFIDLNSIKYNNSGLLSVITKNSEVDPEDQKIINTNSYLLAIDCENRLFSKLRLNGEIKQVKNWINPVDDKLIKKTIVNSCSY